MSKLFSITYWTVNNLSSASCLYAQFRGPCLWSPFNIPRNKIKFLLHMTARYFPDIFFADIEPWSLFKILTWTCKLSFVDLRDPKANVQHVHQGPVSKCETTHIRFSRRNFMNIPHLVGVFYFSFCISGLSYPNPTRWTLEVYFHDPLSREAEDMFISGELVYCTQLNQPRSAYIHM